MTSLPNPDALNRARVIRMARVGMPEHAIAFAISVSINTLRKFYADAIRQAESDLNLAVLETLANLAQSGHNPAATIFWAKTRCGFMPAKGFKSDFGEDMPEFVVRGPNGEREEDYRR
jgi:hypothetical protein